MRIKMRIGMSIVLALLLGLQSCTVMVLNVWAAEQQISEEQIVEEQETAALEIREQKTRMTETEVRGTEEQRLESLTVGDSESSEAETNESVVEKEVYTDETKEFKVVLGEPRAQGDITLKVDGEERVNYTTMGVSDTKTLTISVEGETIKSIKWSSKDSGIISVTGNKDGATVKSYKTGVVDIIAKIETGDGNYTKDITITARKAINPRVSGYAKKATELHRAAQGGGVKGNVARNDSLVVRAECKDYYWVEHNGGTGFVLKENVIVPATGIEFETEYVAIEEGRNCIEEPRITPAIYTGETVWSSDKSRVATVNSRGEITGEKEGTAKVTASVDAMNEKLKASTTVSVWSKLTQMSAVTIKSVNTQKGAITDSASAGTLTAGTQVTIIGQCGSYYYIKQNDNAHAFLPQNAVAIPVTEVTLDKEEVAIKVSDVSQLGITATRPESAMDKSVTWSSTNTAVAKVDAAGTVTGVDKGTATIEVKNALGKIVAKCTVSVWEEISWVQGMTNKNVDSSKGAFNGSANTGKLTKNTAVMILGQCGTYYYVKLTNGSQIFVPQSAVRIPITSVALSQKESTICVGERTQLKITAIKPVSATDKGVMWSSKNLAIAKIDTDGTVTGVKEGTTSIEAKNSDGKVVAVCNISVWSKVAQTNGRLIKKVNGQQGAIVGSASTGAIQNGTKVTIVGQCENYYYVKLTNGNQAFVLKSVIKIPVTSTTLDKKEIAIGVGTTYQLQAAVKPDIATDKNLVWSSRNSGIAKVDKMGKVTGVRQGCTYIVVKATDGKVMAECKVNVKKAETVQKEIVSSVVVDKVSPGYEVADIDFTVNGKADQSATYHLVIYDVRGKSYLETPKNVYIETNVKEQIMAVDLERGKTYYLSVKVTYETGDGKKTKESKRYIFQTKSTKKKNTKVSATLDTKKKKVTLSWKKVNKVLGYEIYRSTKAGERGSLVKVVNKNTTKFTQSTKNMKSGQTYYYRVRPFWAEKKKNKFGTSNQVKVTFKK